MKRELYTEPFHAEVAKLTPTDWRENFKKAPAGQALSGVASAMAFHDARSAQLDKTMAAVQKAQAQAQAAEQKELAKKQAAAEREAAKLQAAKDKEFEKTGVPELNIRSFQEAVSSQEGWDDIDYEKKLELYTDYINTATQLLMEQYPDGDADAIRMALEEQNEPPVMPKTGFIRDLTSGIGSGILGVAGDIEQLGRMAVGNENRAIFLEAADALRDLRSEHFQDQQLRKMRKLSEFLEANPDASKTAQTMNEVAHALESFTVGDTGEIIGGLGGMLLGGILSAGGRLAVRGAVRGAAGAAAKEGTKRSLRKSLTPKVSDLMLIDVADTAGAHLDRVMQQLNGLSMGEFRERVGDEAWQKALAKYGNDEEEARKYLTSRAAKFGAAAAAGITTAADIAPFSPVKMISRMISPNGVVKPLRALTLTPATSVASNVGSTLGSSAAASATGVDVESEGLGELGVFSAAQGLITGVGGAARGRVGPTSGETPDVTAEGILGEATGGAPEGDAPGGSATQLYNADGDPVNIHMDESGTWVYSDGSQPSDSSTDRVLTSMNRGRQGELTPETTAPQPAPAAPQPAPTAPQPAPEGEAPPIATSTPVRRSATDMGFQNRDRSTDTYLDQHRNIRNTLNYLRVGPSSTFSDGAPVVEPGAPVIAVGRPVDQVVGADNTNYPVQYAVVDSNDLIPSHTFDGVPVDAYELGEDGRSRVLVGNGRAIGIHAALQDGTPSVAGQYNIDLINDLARIGITDPAAAEAIRNNPNAMLVRVMRSEDIPTDIGTLSNTPTTQALNDVETVIDAAGRLDVDAMPREADGITPIPDIASWVIGRVIPATELPQYVDESRNLTAKGRDLYEKVMVYKLYGSPEMIHNMNRLDQAGVRFSDALVNSSGELSAVIKAEVEPSYRGFVDELGRIAEQIISTMASGRPAHSVTDHSDMFHPLTPVGEMLQRRLVQDIGSTNAMSGLLTQIGHALFDQGTRSHSGDLFGGGQPMPAPAWETVVEGILRQGDAQGSLFGPERQPPAAPAPAAPAPAAPAPAAPAPAAPAPAAPAPAAPAPAAPAPAAPAPDLDRYATPLDPSTTEVGATVVWRNENGTHEVQYRGTYDPENAIVILNGQQAAAPISELFTEGQPAPEAATPTVGLARPPAGVQEAIELNLEYAQDSSLTPRQRSTALSHIYRSIIRAGRVVRRSYLQANNGSPLSRALNEVGIGVFLSDDLNSRWVQTIMADGRGEVVLTAAGEDPAGMGQSNAASARNILEAYLEAGLVVPRVRITEPGEPVRPRASRVLGMYDANEHQVTLSHDNGTANTLIHELMHGLTVRGLNHLIASSRLNTDEGRYAKGVLEIMEAARRQLGMAAVEGTYGATHVAEMMAEMIRPEAMIAAAETQFNDSRLSANAKRVLDSLEGRNQSLFNLLTRLIAVAIRSLTGGRAGIPLGSIAEVIAKTAAESARRSSDVTAARPVAPPPREATAAAPAQTRPDPAPTQDSSEVVSGYEAIPTTRGNWESFPHTSQLLNGLRPLLRAKPQNLPEPLPASASATTKFRRVVEVVNLFLDGQTVSQPEGESTLRMNGSGTVEIVLPDGSIRRAGIYVAPGSGGTLRIGAASAQAGSGVGGVAYRSILAASANANYRMYNDVLYNSNRGRLPLNRLKGMLLGALVTGDPARAVRLMAVDPARIPQRGSDDTSLPRWVRDRGRVPVAWGQLDRSSSGFGSLARHVINMVEHYLPTQGELGLNPDGSVETPDGPIQPGDLMSWLDLDNRIPWSSESPDSRSTSPEAFVRATQTPSAVMTAALLRSWLDASSQQDRDAVIQAAINSRHEFLADDSGGDSSFLGFSDADFIAEVGEPEAEPSKKSLKHSKDESLEHAAEAAADNLMDVDRREATPRGDAHRLLGELERGEPASPSSVGRELRQARNLTQARSAVGKILSKANELFHTNLEPVNRFLDSIIGSDPARLEQRGEAVRSAMHAAPVIRDYFTTEVRANGGRQLEANLARLAASAKVSEETAVKYAGYLATAIWAPQANQRLINRRANALADASEAVDAARQELEDAMVGQIEFEGTESAPSIQELERAVETAERIEAQARTELLTFITQVNGNANATLSDTKLAGGLNNAQAQAMREVIESKFDKSILADIRNSIYDMNAHKLAMDIESGKTNPETAVEFLGLTGDKKVLETLERLARRGRVASSGNILELEALRKEVAAMVRSEYVPLSGDPLMATDSDMLQADSASPNVGANRRMEGRSTIANDGITESIAQAVKSANYAGWRPFQEALSQLYSQMTFPERAKAGISRGTIGQPGTSITRNSVILRQGESGYVFGLPEQVMNAIRKTNIEDTGGVMRALGRPTQLFAYGATQLNPMFAPKNWIRDVWERSEIIRKYGHVQNAEGKPVDMNKVARSMLSYGLLNPGIFAATARFAAGRPAKDTPADRAIRAIARDGGLSTYGEQFGLDRSDLVKRIARQKSMTRKGMAGLHKLIDIYNKSFDLVSSTAAYMAMTEAGVSSKDAAAVALDTMNFRKKGTIMPQASILYAFAQPAVTSGANMWSTIWDRKNNRVRPVGLARLGSYLLAFYALQGFVRSLDDEDEGGKKLDQLSSFQKMSAFNFIADDQVYSIPLAFGLPRLANGFVLNSYEVANNNKSIGEAATDFLGENVVPAFSPVQATDIDPQANPFQFLISTFAPTVIKPMTTVGVGMTDFGSPLRPAFPKADQFMSDQGRDATAKFWKDVARELRKGPGGFDLTPEEVRALGNGYAVGIFRTAMNAFVETPNKERRGLATGNPLLAGVVTPVGDHGVVSQYYQAKTKLEKLNRTVKTDGLKTLNADERRLYRMYEKMESLEAKYRSEAGKITRSRISEKAKDSRRHALAESKRQEQFMFVRELRKLEGKDYGTASSFRRRPMPREQ